MAKHSETPDEAKAGEEAQAKTAAETAIELPETAPAFPETVLISAEKFLSLQPASVILPHGEDGGTDAARIETAPRLAAGVITAHLPWLLDGAGEIARPVNPQFSDALEAVCADIALGRLTATAAGSENTRNKYRESLALLEKINREYQGGLEGPGCRESAVIIAGKDGIDDGRFFKKGKVFYRPVLHRRGAAAIQVRSRLQSKRLKQFRKRNCKGG